MTPKLTIYKVKDVNRDDPWLEFKAESITDALLQYADECIDFDESHSPWEVVLKYGSFLLFCTIEYEEVRTITTTVNKISLLAEVP